MEERKNKMKMEEGRRWRRRGTKGKGDGGEKGEYEHG
jgi:hypothetical protein